MTLSLHTGKIPETHLDLLTRPICGVLSTVDPTGIPQSSLVWLDYDGECARINTTLERRKASQSCWRIPRVSLLIVDPDDTGRYHPGPRHGGAGAAPARSSTSTP